MIDIRTTSIEFLKGVGPARAQLLRQELDINTYEDLLLYFPFRYVDCSKVLAVDEITPDSPYVVLRGLIDNVNVVQTGKFTERLTARFHDATGSLELVWFQGVKWVKDRLKPNVEYQVMGKPSNYGLLVQLVHPDVEPVTYDAPSHSFMPIYNTTEKLKAKGLNPKGIAKLVDTLLRQVQGMVPENLPFEVVSRYRLISRERALHDIHFPADNVSQQAASLRLKFEELFFLQLDFQYGRTARQRYSEGRIFSEVGAAFNRFYSEKLPFPLTGAQKRVIREIRNDMRSGRQMNRLLQGDVGSGKTLVALLTMLLAVDNGFQACLMAPTEILASQHYQNFLRMLDGLGIQVALLTGSVKGAQRKKIKEGLLSGEINLLIGTHALIEDEVKFNSLGYVVIDEQHRFGVQQRAKLWTKSIVPPHVLVMTATPIPRTLSMTLYGDLDCSVIDELPPGRQPIKTIHATDAKRLVVFDFMKKQIALGRQVYVVYPLINESDSLDLKDLMDGYESISRDFPLPQYQVSIVHGQMDAETKAYEMDRFKRGETHIMVSTTVIEVGVDVPNATVMVIENAERFGLSQLHQLRGRVGRGGGQSYCILMTKEKLSSNARERINTMVATCDGFQIAEADLRLRGPGDIEGIQQSGILDLHIADIVTDEPLVRATRDTVRELLDADPDLQKPENRVLRYHIETLKNKPRWGKIS